MKRALTDTAVRNTKAANTAFKLYDGGGLYLLVTPTGSKHWRYKFRLGGKENVYAIGSYSEGMSLAAARAKHEWARKLVQQGISPREQRDKERLEHTQEAASTFKSVAVDWIDKHREKWSGYYLRQVERTMEVDVLPKIGSLPIKAVSHAQLLDVIKRVESRGAETIAILIRQWCSAIFKYAMAHGLANSDPAAALRGAIVRPKVRHNPPLDPKELPGFRDALEKFGGYRVTAIAIELLMLTFVRTAELRKATWAEFDLDNATWQIPAERMKMRQRHVVPLSTQSLDRLRELRDWTGGRQFLFPNNRQSSQCMSATTINRALERMGYRGKLSGHGFRSTASTILYERGFRSEVIEKQLAHSERNSVKAAYNHADYREERAQMLQAWADYVLPPIDQ